MDQEVIVAKLPRMKVLEAAITDNSQGSGYRTRLWYPMMRYVILTGVSHSVGGV